MKAKLGILISTVTVTVASILFGGCSLIKDGETVNWDKVDTISALVQTTAQVSTYAVCVKNKDLAPIFKSIGEGIVVISGAQSSSEMTPEQIQAYIKNLLSENKGWGSLADQVNGVMNTLIDIYSNFISINKDKFTDEVKVFAKVVNAMGKGLISGSNVDTASANQTADKLDAKAKELVAKVKAMDLSVAE